MSFKTLHIGVSSLMTSQLALNTTGHNIANAATPGYTRQRVNPEAALPDVKSFGVLGSGVQVKSIKRIADDFLERQVREAGTLHSYYDTHISSYENIQAIFNELTDNDLSSTFDQFWNAIADTTNMIEDISTRRALVNEGEVLAEAFNNMDHKFRDMRERMNENVANTVEQINTLTEEVARLNADIVRAEKGGLSGEMANDSRDQRTERLRELGEILDINVVEEPNGQVVVSLGGRLLVFENQSFRVDSEQVQSDDLLIDRVIYERDGEELTPGDGKLGAFVNIRDNVLLSYKNDIDRLAGTFLWEFNRQHSQGQGLAGFQSVTSKNTVIDPLVALDELEFEFEPLSDTFNTENGNVELKVRNEVTGELTTLNVEIDLDNTSSPDTVLYHDNNADDDNQLSNWNLNGVDFGIDTATNGALYADLSEGPPGTYTIDLYRTSAMLPGDHVATGTRVGDGSVTMNQVGGSGISGTIDVTFVQPDNNIVKGDLFGNSFVSKVDSALQDFLPNTFQVSVDNNNRVTIESVSPNYTIGFGRDTSGVLAALGMNTFFDGYDAGSIAVDERVKARPELFAGADDFVVGDNDNATALLQLRERNIYDTDTSTVDDFYQGVVGRMGIEFDQMDSLLETQEDILMRVKNQREDLSGVNMDEELALMIQFQRTFQGSARFISTADSIYESLISM